MLPDRLSSCCRPRSVRCAAWLAIKNNRLNAKGTQNKIAKRRRVLACTATPIVFVFSSTLRRYVSPAAILAYCTLLLICWRFGHYRPGTPHRQVISLIHLDSEAVRCVSDGNVTHITFYGCKAHL